MDNKVLYMQLGERVKFLVLVGVSPLTLILCVFLDVFLITFTSSVSYQLFFFFKVMWYIEWDILSLEVGVFGVGGGGACIHTHLTSWSSDK